VYGPGTFLNVAAGTLQDELGRMAAGVQRQGNQGCRAARRASRRRGDPPARQRMLCDAARQLVQQQFQEQLLRLALRTGLSGVPRLNDPSFVDAVVFGPPRAGQPKLPKARFAYLFPSRNAALIQIRLRPDLSDSERTRAIDLIREATRQDRFRPRQGARYVISGVPVVVDSLASAVQRSIFVLLAAALLVMALTLAAVFRSRLRLLPLGLALVAAALTFGGVSLLGWELTMASIAVLPVLIGLAVDYAIQFQSRFDEAWYGPERPSARDAAVAAVSAGGPTIAAAGLATLAGFAVVLASPIPMVRGFGVMLMAGIVLAFACVLTAGFAALVMYWRGPSADVPPMFPRLRSAAARVRHRLAQEPLVRDVAARARRAGGWIAERARLALDYAIRRPRRVLAIAAALAVLGWAADTQTEVISDVRELVPQDLQALKDVERLQEATGVSGEIDVTVRADDITRPEVLQWMTRFQEETLAAHGYRTGGRCREEAGAQQKPAELCPALSLPDLFSSLGPADQRTVQTLLAAVPPYFSQGVVAEPAADGKRKVATLAFGIRLMPLDRQQEVIEDIKRRLNPPPGVEADVAGLPVLAAEANDKLSDAWRRAATLLAGLLLVFLVLLGIRRSTEGALVPLLPIALATGWSALVLFLLRIPLNPMSLTLSALVIAIATEFSVLLSARYDEERRRGASAEEAIDLTYSSTGAAVLASGATAIAGFAALTASDIRMLRDFGIVTVVDLTVALLGVMLVLPAVLVWVEERGGFTLRDLDPRRLPGALAGGARVLGGAVAGGARGLAGAARAVRRPRRRRPLRRTARRGSGLATGSENGGAARERIAGRLRLARSKLPVRLRRSRRRTRV
jgi:predicted RND superfamily exporter protein